MTDYIKSLLLHEVSPPVTSSGNKVTIVGVGQVGMACAFSILSQGISTDIALVDCVADKLQGEMLDLQHGAAFLKHATVAASTDYAVSAGSRLCIITAGARQREGESRLDLVQRNTDILKGIVPQLVTYSPDCVILVVSNPVDVLTHVAWRLSGLPRHRVLGSGTNLDSSRFRFLLSQQLGVAASSVHGWVVGEHGDSSVAVWSGVNVAGVRLRELAPEAGGDADKSALGSVHDQVVSGAYEVIKLKGYTSWAVGLSVAALTAALLRNASTVHAVSTHVEGLHGIEHDVCLSLPAVLGSEGVTSVVQQTFTEDELKKLHQSAELMAQVQRGLTI